MLDVARLENGSHWAEPLPAKLKELIAGVSQGFLDPTGVLENGKREVAQRWILR
jgi:hypothetical protein